MRNLRKTIKLVKQLQTLAQEWRDIKHDATEFDGDRRGHWAAITEVEEEIINTVLDVFKPTVKP